VQPEITTRARNAAFLPVRRVVAANAGCYEHPTVDDAEAAVLKLGATSLSGGMNWRVYADPAGNPFCLCWDQRCGSPRAEAQAVLVFSPTHHKATQVRLPAIPAPGDAR